MQPNIKRFGVSLLTWLVSWLFGWLLFYLYLLLFSLYSLHISLLDGDDDDDDGNFVHTLNNLYNLTRSHASILNTAIDRFALPNRKRNSLVMTTPATVLFFRFL